jgi:pimeloyl-ACP methyl ester carboxylesterase
MRLLTVPVVLVTLSVICQSVEAQAVMGQKPLKVGPFESRALMHVPEGGSASEPKPAIILIPGSGEFGPEEMQPTITTHWSENGPTGTDGQPLLSIWAQAFASSGFATLQLGKPGVEFFTDFDSIVNHTNFYDHALWQRLQWTDLVSNVQAAVALLRADPRIDSNKIYLLGHSEGTIVATDVASADPRLAGVILLGFAGESGKSILHWQAFDRSFDMLISPDIDANRDAFISKAEADAWPPTVLFPPSMATPWNWSKSPRIPIAQLHSMWLADPALIATADINGIVARFPFWRQLSDRQDIKETAASIRGPVFAFTGDQDINTPAPWVLALGKVCVEKGKIDCHVTILPGLTHKFAPIKTVAAGPRPHAILDQGYNAVSQSFLKTLSDLAESLSGVDR